MADIEKEQLEGKSLQQWSEEERKAAEEMSHTISVNYLLVRQLASLGTKTQSYEDILEQVLDASCLGNPGIYSINSTGEAVPLAVEDGSGDHQLLKESLEHHGYHIVDATQYDWDGEVPPGAEDPEEVGVHE